MSYLVDALKKAERERRAQRDADLRSVSASDAAVTRRGGSRTLIAVVLVLVVVNVGLLAYLWYPHREAGATATGSTPVADSAPPADRSAPAARPSAVHDPSQSSDVASTARTSPIASGGRPSAASAGAAHLSPTTGRSLPGLKLAEPSLSDEEDGAMAGREHRGSVTFSRVPLNGDDEDSQPADVANTALPTEAALGGSVPAVTIKGQLYSSVPGRSFILVDGRRYHEGERMASGPAVESIDPNGATLLYHGQRYHVPGPG